MTKTYLASLVFIYVACSFIGGIVALVPDKDWNRGLVYALIAAVLVVISNRFSYWDGKQESKP